MEPLVVMVEVQEWKNLFKGLGVLYEKEVQNFCIDLFISIKEIFLLQLWMVWSLFSQNQF